MNRLRTLLIDRSHPVLISRLEATGRFSLIPAYDWTQEQILEEIPAIEGVVIRSRISLDRAFFQRASRLLFVAREGIGLEHIDVDAASELGIQVLNSPEGSRDTVAEHAMGMLLGLLAHVPRADRQVRGGQWDREGNRATELKGKTVGIIGYGNTGMQLARRLQGFACEVLAYDKYRIDYGDAYATAVSLGELQQRADIVSLHIPYDTKNHYFANEAFFTAFRKPIFLINTARGLVLETTALVNAMQKDRVRGAALDVIEYEDSSFEQLARRDAEVPPPLQYLRQSDKTILTPHIAGWSFESKERHAEVLAQKITQLFT